MPPLVTVAPTSSASYEPTPVSQLNVVAAAPVSGADLFPGVSASVGHPRLHASPPDPFLLCLPVPLPKAAEGLEDDILEASIRESGIRPPVATEAASDVAPDVVVESDYSDLEPTVTPGAIDRPRALPSTVSVPPSRYLVPSSAPSSLAGSRQLPPSYPALEDRGDRRRRAGERWGSPSPRRRSPLYHSSGERLPRPPCPRARASPPVVTLSQSEYSEYRRLRQEKSKNRRPKN